MLISIIPAFIITTTIGGKYVAKYTTVMSNHLADATGIVAESLGNMQVVLAFNAGHKLENIFAKQLELARDVGSKKAFASACQLGSMFFIGYAANALAFWQGSVHIANVTTGGGDTGGTVGAVYTVIFVLLDGGFSYLSILIPNTNMSPPQPRSSCPRPHLSCKSLVLQRELPRSSWRPSTANPPSTARTTRVNHFLLLFRVLSSSAM